MGKSVPSEITLVCVEFFLATINYLLGLSIEFANEKRVTSDEQQELGIDIFGRQYDLLQVNTNICQYCKGIYANMCLS